MCTQMDPKVGRLDGSDLRLSGLTLMRTTLVSHSGDLPNPRPAPHTRRPSQSQADDHSCPASLAVFQQIDIDEFAPPGESPQIRAFGVTQAGHSVMMHVSGFLPYFYIAAPRGLTTPELGAFRDHLNVSRNNSSDTD